jgi:hypothetical protein
MFSWTAASGMVDRGAPPGAEQVAVNAANLLGRVVGSAHVDGSTMGFSWTQSTGFVELGTFGGTATIPFDVSLFGRVTIS